MPWPHELLHWTLVVRPLRGMLPAHLGSVLWDRCSTQARETGPGMRQGDVVISSGGEFTTAIASVTAKGLMARLSGPVVLAVACMMTAACTSVFVEPKPGSDASPVVSRGCGHLARDQFEVCYAYVVDDSLLARVPYYELGRQPVLGPLALTRLESRYYGEARRLIIAQTKGWPRQVDVSVPSIEIVGPVRVSANLATATITTIETWVVRAEPADGSSGRVLFAETDARHTIWLDRMPTILCLADHCLHKWVVVQIR
jgi:hypothetical protein